MLDPRLKNFLKLPKAANWLYYEWFYSDMDKVIFDMDSEFIACLRSSFPDLKTTNILRPQWCKIRKLLGKPRRCSQAFFNEERNALKIKRDKIRSLWHIDYDKTTDFNTTLFINNILMGKGGSNNMANNASAIEDYFLQDLPPYIPHPLIVGSKVMARIRRPCDGMFRGRITAIDHSKWEYRIAFDQPFLGTQSIPDFEIMSWRESENDHISVISILKTNNVLSGQHHGQPHFMRLHHPTLHAAQMKSPIPDKSFLSPLHSPKFGGGICATAMLNKTPLRFNSKGVAEVSGSQSSNNNYPSTDDKALTISPLGGPDNINSDAFCSPAAASNIPSLLSYPGTEDDTKSGKLLAPANDWRSILLRNIHAENGRLANNSATTSAENTTPQGLVCGRLETLVRVAACYKLLMYKAKYLDSLRKMNREAEKIQYTSQHVINNAFAYPQEFKVKYANLVLKIIELDRSLFELCNKVSSRTTDKLGKLAGDDAIPSFRPDDTSLDYLKYTTKPWGPSSPPPFNDGNYNNNTTWFKVKNEYYFNEAARLVHNVLSHNQGTYAALAELAKTYHESQLKEIAQLPHEREDAVNLVKNEPDYYRADCAATKILNLITHYTSTLIQLKLSPSKQAATSQPATESTKHPFEHQSWKEDTIASVNASDSSAELYRLESLGQAISHIRNGVLENKTLPCFRDQVEVHINHLKNMIINARRPILNLHNN